MQYDCVHALLPAEDVEHLVQVEADEVEHGLGHLDGAEARGGRQRGGQERLQSQGAVLEQPRGGQAEASEEGGKRRSVAEYCLVL